MNSKMPSDDEWARYIDGDVTENRAREIERLIVEDKSAAAEAKRWRAMTSGLRTPVGDDASTQRMVDGVMARLGETPAARPSRARLWSAGSLVAAAAAAIFFLVSPPSSRHADGAFVARGGSNDAYKLVGVGLFVVDGPKPDPLGKTVTATTAYLGAGRNLSPDKAAHVLVFAVDADTVVHWLYPAFVDATQDPQALRVPANSQAHFADQVVLDSPALGTMRVITMVTRVPLHVSDIESLSPAARQTAALRKRFPTARIDEQRVEVKP